MFVSLASSPPRSRSSFRSASPRQVEQPRAPIETSGPLWAAACNGSDDWQQAGAAGPHLRQHLSRRHLRHFVDPHHRSGGRHPDRRRDRGRTPISSPTMSSKLGFRLTDIKYLLHQPRAFRPCRRPRQAAADDRRATGCLAGRSARCSNSGMPATGRSAVGRAQAVPAGARRPRRARTARRSGSATSC